LRPYEELDAVLSHQMEDKVEKPILFASRSLASAEKGYYPLEKELYLA